MRRWRKRGERENYKGKRKEYRKFCERKKIEENEKWMRKAKEAKRESKVWELINKDRKKVRKVNKEIEIKEWEEYFKGILRGVEVRVIGRERKGETREEDELSREEVKRAINRVRVGKATGSDGIPGKV